MFFHWFVLAEFKALPRLPGTMLRTHFFFALSLFAIFPRIVQAACPDLTAYYPSGPEGTDWPTLSQQLASLQPECLESAEFYALYGAALLNSGNLPEAGESLERALLLEPGNGSAQIDYAQALFLQGQLFSALELNQQLLQRQDLPGSLQSTLEDRQQNWQSLTRERSGRIDLLTGYDTNLNSAPNSERLSLSLSGQPVLVELSDEFKPTRGPYLNFRVNGRYRQFAPQHQHNWLLDMRGRFSEDTDSDLLQLEGRYSFVRPGRSQSWELNGGVSHLLFGGTSLFTAADVRALYQPNSNLRCRPYYGLALQSQLFHGQSHLDALESKASAGMNCPLDTVAGNHLLSAEVGLLNNSAVNNGRPGGSRHGWQVNLGWRYRLPQGEIISQITHNQWRDDKGYTPLLADGARRWLRSSFALLQYRRPFLDDLTLMVNFYHQRQDSNLKIFKSNDTALEIGISLAL